MHEAPSKTVFEQVDITNPAVANTIFSFDKQVQERVYQAGHQDWFEPMDREAWEECITGSHTFTLQHPDYGLVAYACFKPAPVENVGWHRLYDKMAGTRDTPIVHSLNVVELTTMAAYPQRRGFARMISDLAEVEIQKAYQEPHITDLMVHFSVANKPARALYTNLGYRPTQSAEEWVYYLAPRDGGPDWPKHTFFKFIGTPEDKEKHLSLMRVSRAFYELNGKELNAEDIASAGLMHTARPVYSPYDKLRHFQSREEWSSLVTMCITDFLRTLPDAPTQNNYHQPPIWPNLTPVARAAEERGAADLSQIDRLTEDQQVALIVRLEQHNLSSGFPHTISYSEFLQKLFGLPTKQDAWDLMGRAKRWLDRAKYYPYEEYYRAPIYFLQPYLGNSRNM